MKLKELLNESVESLANRLFNTSLYEHASYDGDDEDDEHGHGKRVPFIGWFWRSCDFVGKNISIGDCHEFIGVMENNKWGYSERRMTPEEVDIFIDYLERGLYKEDIMNKMWDWFQTLKISDDNNYEQKYADLQDKINKESK